jgi:DNA invertase Pin-like site-specific DNA recombinase
LRIYASLAEQERKLISERIKAGLARSKNKLGPGGVPTSILDATPLLGLITHPNGREGKVLVYALK